MKTPSSEPVLKSRSLPRFSFRMMFGMVTVTAVLAAIATNADRGSEFARALVVAIGFPAVCFVAFAFLFLLAWVGQVRKFATAMAALVVCVASLYLDWSGVAIPGSGNLPVAIACFIVAVSTLLKIVIDGLRNDSTPENPFAEGQLPPQILKPREGPQ